MALEQTITVVNNSGKIIKTGKQLFTIFKEAQGNYKDKKAEIKASQSLQRSKTFDAEGRSNFIDDDRSRYYPPRAAPSEAGSQRSRRSRSVHSRHPRDDFDVRSRKALTLDNLERHTEISATAPSKAPTQMMYKDPYAQTMNYALSPRSMAPSAYGDAMVPRNRSTGELVQATKPRKEIDMDLAYGSIPPDLKDRTDLDPQQVDEKQAMGLVHRVEGLLTEAKCIHHSATLTMSELQKNPDHAAAVALTLAELSKIVKKTSPAFLTLLKSGSPAVFGLLSSPQFLIGTSIAAGVTVICFGGWKIFQRMAEAKAAREALGYEGVPMDRPAPMRTQSEYAPAEYGGMDEALILDDDLSSIETWMRGIPAGSITESVDMELITPTAYDSMGDDFDTKSRRSTRTTRTSKTSKTHDSHRSSKSHRTEGSHRSSRSRRDDDTRSKYTESIADSERSHRSSRSKRTDKTETRSIDSRSSSRRDDASEVTLRPKPNRNNSNMLKALFKNKEKKERSLVMA
ncbi:hypothetical protein FSPOR_6816 [Fusarium sporotrichioides]|uniref:Mfs general substrate transporter n=1 Tax=Fusarium sporotrichioides TaxID=5514 RepID=A0A395S0P3_FUSSP|nr:hypothetical protein FSPOR_6816 [Fusarium sporotrichioides]